MSDQKEKFRTHLSEDELSHFEEKLKEERKNCVEEIENLKSSADSIDTDANDRKSGVDHHPGDVASDDHMKKTTYQLLENQLEKLKKIDAALERIKLGTYGVCTATGKPIQKERLEAIPFVLHSVEAKTKK